MDCKSKNYDWRSVYANIKSNHDDAYGTIQEAIVLEENEKPIQALEKYKDGIVKIDTALNVRVEYPESPDGTWMEACKMIQKLKRTRAEVLTRINSLKKQFRGVTLVGEEHGNPSADVSLWTYSELANALENLQVQLPTRSPVVIFTHDNANMYKISPDGTVVAAEDCQKITIYSIEDQVPSFFLQVGDWIYPLIPGVSPCYRTDYHCYVFPDIDSNVEGLSVGIIVTGDADDVLYELLTNILHGVVVQHAEPASQITSEKISSGIITGASYLAHGLIVGAESIGNLLRYGTPKLLNNITPATDDKVVPPAVRDGVKITETATNKTVQITGYIAEKVVYATSKLGQYLAPHIQRQGSRLLQSSLNYSEEEAAQKVKGVLTVAAGAVEGLQAIYTGLEQSGNILGRSLKENTVEIVKHKYGTSAANVAANTMDTVGNIVLIGRNTNILTLKGVAKQSAKAAGKAVVADYAHGAQKESTNVKIVELS